jgi:hypothetical protein
MNGSTGHDRHPSQFPTFRVRPCTIAVGVLTLCLLFSNTPGAAQAAAADPGNYIVETLEGTAAISHGNDITFIATNCDDCRTPVTLPFPYTFYGKTYPEGSEIWINSNGILEFEPNTAWPFVVTDLPAPALHHGIFAYWDDLQTNVGPDPGVLGVRTSVSGIAPERIFNIEWRATYFRNSALETNFQVRLYEGQSRFDVIYANPGDGGAFATVGVQSTADANHTRYSSAAPVLTPGLGLRFDMRRPTTLSANGAAGSYRGTTELSARLVDAGGPVVGATIAFELDGVFAGAAVSDANGTATVAGVPLDGRAVGTYANAVRARFAGTRTHLASEANAPLLVERATPVITWTSPTPIVYGTALDADQLNATADVPGTFVYTPAAGHVPDAGTHALALEFLPEDSANYNAVRTNKSLVVSRAELTIAADDKTRLVGAANPVFTGSMTGLHNGDAIAVTYRTDATVASPAGTYAIVPSVQDPSGRASNYTVTLRAGELKVTNGVCALYDQTRAHKSGRTIPIKVQLCAASGANISSPSIVVNALELVLISTLTTGVPEDAGDANPDGNFRYTWFGSGPGYIFNLKTTDLPSGTYRLVFGVSGDPGTHSVEFQLR